MLTTFLRSRAALSVIRRAKHSFHDPNRFVIGSFSGFWGDSPSYFDQLLNVQNPNLKPNVIIGDYLSEITITLLKKRTQFSKSPGYITEFVSQLNEYRVRQLQKQKIKVIVNAGGIDVIGAADKVREALRDNGSAGRPLKIGYVTGETHSSVNETGRENLLACYYGAYPIARLLQDGCDIIVTGRCSDAALCLAPLMHHFDWFPEQFESQQALKQHLDRLAVGTVAGHLIECGPQCVGGLFTDYSHHSKAYKEITCPIVVLERQQDDKYTLKLSKTDGMMDSNRGILHWGSVAEQLLYEVGNPKRYLHPDVTCDITNVSLSTHKSEEFDYIEIDGVAGALPPSQLLMQESKYGGLKTIIPVVVGGRDAAKKARMLGETLIDRINLILKRRKIPTIKEYCIEIIGSGSDEDEHGLDSSSVLLWLAVRHPNKAGMEVLREEVACAGTAMMPGLTTLIGGRPQITPYFCLANTSLDRAKIALKIGTCLADGTDGNNDTRNSVSESVSDCDPMNKLFLSQDFSKVLNEQRQLDDDDAKLYNESCVDVFDPYNDNVNLDEPPFPRSDDDRALCELAFLRSGDKAADVNIGVIARDDEAFEVIDRKLTAEAVHWLFYVDPLASGKSNVGAFVNEIERVERYKLPGLRAFNFVLRNGLMNNNVLRSVVKVDGGLPFLEAPVGGTSSLFSDPQGKAFASRLASVRI